jgi:hypothetical protein
MGTINYGTSEYITIGYNCNYLETDDDRFFVQVDFDQIAGILKNEFFYYFHVTLNPGYYEGYYINIEYNFPICFDDYIKKQAAQKEITRIKQFLLKCIEDFGCCAVFPGWCTGYADYKETHKLLNAAMREMRDDVRTTPTWQQYRKEAEIC